MKKPTASSPSPNAPPGPPNPPTAPHMHSPLPLPLPLNSPSPPPRPRSPRRSAAKAGPRFSLLFSSLECSWNLGFGVWSFVLCYFVLLSPASLAAAAPILPDKDQASLIAILQSSSASPHDKDAACAELKRIGTTQSISALASLLTDAELSHSARYVLEAMSAPEVGRALLGALDKTSGALRVGIINSLGVRRDRAAIPALTELAADPEAASAVANTLGHIGGDDAVKAIESAPWPKSDSVHRAVADSFLRCAQEFLTSKEAPKALPLFQRIYEKESLTRYRIAAYRGMILSSTAGDSALKLLTDAIAGKPGPAQIAALQLVHDGQLPNAADTLAKLLPNLEPAVQVSLIGGLGQYGAYAAAPAIVAQAKAQNADVRLAALKALGSLAHLSAIPVLAEAAASGTPDEQNAARRSLVELRHAKTTETLLAQLQSAQPSVQAEIARALGERGNPSAVSKLLELAQTGSDSVRKAALSALALLAGQENLSALVGLVEATTSETARVQAVETLNSACQRIQSKYGCIKTGPITKALASASGPNRIALLPICSGIIDPDIRSALRAALKDTDLTVHATALRAICNTKDAELLPELVQVVREPGEENFRTLAVAACVRLTTQEDAVKLNLAQRLDILKQILATTLRPEQKRLVLAGLAELPLAASLKLVQPLLDDPTVKTEAAQAAIKIAPALPISQSTIAAAALKSALAAVTDPTSRQAAETALKQIEAISDYITVWQAAGPYLQDGQNYSALFGIAFPPEKKDAKDVAWKPLAPHTNPAKPWLMDLLKAFGGEERVAYARTSIHCDQEQSARLEVGSDDGLKVWFNEKLVITHNTFRGLTPGSDKADITLKSGWNSLLLKVTQLNQGWEFCARIVKPDGSPVENLQYDAEPH
jgi:HEAT repeat protein